MCLICLISWRQSLRIVHTNSSSSLTSCFLFTLLAFHDLSGHLTSLGLLVLHECPLVALLDHSAGLTGRCRTPSSLVAGECRSGRHESHAQTAEQEGLPSKVLAFARVDVHTICSVFVTLVSFADMWMSMGNRFVPMRMRVPVETICLHLARFSIGMLVGMVRVLVAKIVQVLVLMPYLVMTVPMGVVFLQQQNNAAHHQGT